METFIVIFSACIAWYIGYLVGRSAKIQYYEGCVDECIADRDAIEKKCDFKVESTKSELRKLKATWPEAEIQRRVSDYLMGLKLNEPITALNPERSVATDDSSEKIAPTA